MRTFLCSGCGLAISGPDDITDQEVTCPGCQKRQPVPADTRAGTAAPATPLARPEIHLFSMPGVPPAYFGTAIIASILRFLGALTMIVGFVFCLERPLPGLITVFSGLTTAALGQILSLARTIAQQTFPRREGR